MNVEQDSLLANVNTVGLLEDKKSCENNSSKSEATNFGKQLARLDGGKALENILQPRILLFSEKLVNKIKLGHTLGAMKVQMGTLKIRFSSSIFMA